MKKHSQPKGLAPGIYFNLHEDAYHADPALSHSGMIKLLDSPLDYWETGPLNPMRQEYKASDAMIFGKRCHALLLEPKVFQETYNVTGMGYDAKKKLINRTDWDNIKASIDMIKAVPDAHAYFTKGYPEVSIIVVDPATGIRLRIRIDYMRTFGGSDYKRAKSLQNNQLGWFIADHGYDIQEWLYKYVMSLAKMGLRKGTMKAHGPHDVPWLKAFADDERVLFRFFFQRSTKPYIFRILSMEEEIMQIARVRMEQAVDIYKRHIELYGAERWPAGKAEPEEFSAFHLPRRIYDQGT